MKLSVIIVNYNVKRFLFQCLRSVEAATCNMEADIWVVDNNSSDGSIEFMRSYFPKVHFIQNESNVGFSAANNKAIRFSEGEYVLLLNPDTIVTPQAIKEGVAFMDEHPNAASAGTSMYGFNGKFANESLRGIPTPLVSFCKIVGLNKLFPRNRVFGRYYMQYLDRTQVNKIEILSGAYMLLRRAALDKEGLLDEDFFMYGEDIDLSYRMLLGGWKNYYLPNAIVHYKGESEHPSTVRYVNVFHQAMILFYEKHFRRRYFLSGMLIRMAVYAKAFITLMRYLLDGWLTEVRVKKEPSHLLSFVDDKNKEKVTDILRGMNATPVFLNSIDDIASNELTDSALLFDTELMSYAQIIDALVKHNPNHLTLYTYHPEIGILVP